MTLFEKGVKSSKMMKVQFVKLSGGYKHAKFERSLLNGNTNTVIESI